MFGSRIPPFFLSTHKSLKLMDATDIPTDPSQAFRVGEWSVFPDRNEIRRGDQSTRIQPRLIQILRLLALTPGRTVSREKLLGSVWSRRMVNDEVLSRSIADLRQALADDARQPRYLETIPKLGYRLIAEVEWLPGEDTAPADCSGSVDERPKAAISPEPRDLQPRATTAHASLKRAIYLCALLLGAGTLLWTGGGRREQTPTEILDQRLQRAQPMSSDPGWELTPRFAHDGDLLVYSELEAEGTHARLRLRSRDGRVNRQLGDGQHYDLCPVFAPDDQQIAWVRRSERGCELLRAPVLGGAAITVAQCAAQVFSCPDWMGDWLIYTAAPGDDSSGAGLSRVSLRTGKVEALTRPTAAQGDDIHPRFAADGRVLYARGVEGERRLYQWSVAAGAVELPFPPSMLYGQLWLPNGQILAASDALGFRALLGIDPDTGSSRLLGGRGARHPDLAADGALVFEQASYDANLWWIAADGTGLRQLTRSQRYDAYPRLSPDGAKVLYQSNRDGPESLYLLDLDSGQEQRLPLDPSKRWAQPAWSVDGSQLLLTQYSDNTTSVWLYVLGSEAPSAIDGLPEGAHDAQFDPDGEHAWFRSGPERSGPLLRFALGDPGVLESGPPAVEHYQINALGLFLTTPGQEHLQHCPDLRGQNCKVLPIALHPKQRRNWAVADGSVYFVSSLSSASNQVQRYRLHEGIVDSLPWPRPGSLSRALDVDPHGAFAIIARTDHIDVDLMWVSPAP